MQRETQALRTLAGKAGDSDLEPMLQAAAVGLAGRAAAGRERPLRARQADASRRTAGATRRSSSSAAVLRPAGWRVDASEGRLILTPRAAARSSHEHRQRSPSLPPRASHAQPAQRAGRAPFWRARAPRERQLLVAGARRRWSRVAGLADRWSSRRWRTLREAPAELDRLDAQLQQMQIAAAESAALRAAPPVPPAQAGAALQAATERLGGKGKTALQGDRAVAHLHRRAVRGTCATGSAEVAQRGARAADRGAAAQARAAGYSGTIVVDARGQLRDPRAAQAPALDADRRRDRLGRIDLRRAGLGQVAQRGACAGPSPALIVGVLVGAGRCSRRPSGSRARSPRRPTSACSSPMRAARSGPAAPSPS